MCFRPKHRIIATKTSFYNTNSMKRFLTLLTLTYAVIGVSAQGLQLNSKDYLERRGVNVMVYSNPLAATDRSYRKASTTIG